MLVALRQMSNFQLPQWQERYMYTRRWLCCPLCTRPTRLLGIFRVLVHWNNSPRIDISRHSDTLSWFRANQSLLLLLNSACFGEKQYIPIL